MLNPDKQKLFNFVLCRKFNNTIRHVLPLGLMHLVNVGSQLWTSLAEVYTAGETEASAEQKQGQISLCHLKVKQMTSSENVLTA